MYIGYANWACVRVCDKDQREGCEKSSLRNVWYVILEGRTSVTLLFQGIPIQWVYPDAVGEVRPLAEII